MNPGQFYSQVSSSWALLQRVGIASERLTHPPPARGIAARFRALDYEEIWKEHYRNQSYDILLTDGSMLVFTPRSFRPLKVSYSYYECPFQVISYEDFIVEVLVMDPFEVGDGFRREYEDYIPTLEPKPSVTPVRYDFEPDTYNPGIHPASHIHIGASNTIRIETRRVLKPISFTLFVLRHCYPERWLEFAISPQAQALCRNVRVSLDLVDPAFHSRVDDWHMSLE